MIFNDKELARSLIEDFDGSVLLKGSRVNELEQLLPSWTVPQEEALEC